MLFGVIGVIGVLASVVAVWAHQTIFSSEKVADAVDQALLNPEVNDALALFLTDEVMDALPLETFVEERVPAELQPLAPVFVGGVRNVQNNLAVDASASTGTTAGSGATIPRRKD